MTPHAKQKPGRRPPAAPGAAAALAPTVTAFRLFPTTFAIHPSASHRDWMHDTDGRFAYRCLPLVIANQGGWTLTSGRTVVARWNGGDEPEDLAIRSPDGEEPPASSQFGHGILSWEVPFLFRTSPGYNLLVRGPANWWKDGAAALEGVVETDWAVATFTMNWKLTRPNVRVRFGPDDPVCMLVPQRRGELESFEPRVRSVRGEPELLRQYRAWERARNRVIAAAEEAAPADAPVGWQLPYLRGPSPGGAGAPEHQTKLHLNPFLEHAGTRPRTR
jgi:hypothetical protein